MCCSAVAAHTEDVVYQIATEWVCKKQEAGPEKAESNWMMQVHHFSTAGLCIGSYITGYARIGSLVMFLHDFSDVFIDVLRLTTIIPVADVVLIGTYVLTMLAWFWWRLVYYPIYILGTIVGELECCMCVKLVCYLCVLRSFTPTLLCLCLGHFAKCSDSY
jgi:hypothetical protein